MNPTRCCQILSGPLIKPQQLLEAIAKQVQVSAPVKAKASGKKEAFDRSELMGRVDGDERLCDEILDLFMQDTPVQLEKLKRAMEGNDATQVEKQAHAIKGASANIGAHALRDAAFEMEMAGRRGDLNPARTLENKLETEFEKLRTALSCPGAGAGV